LNILLIDDEREFCHQVKNYLDARSHAVQTESNGLIALDRYNHLLPDIVVIDVDLGLRELDGRAICAEIAKSSHYLSGKLGIVMISGHYIAPSDEVLGFEIGADNYLIKPFELSRLAARIDALSRRLKVRKDCGVVTAGELVVDTNAHTVEYRQKTVNLSRLEFKVLAYLISNSGQVRTKAQLLENVWETIHVEEGAIAKCVSILRRKIFAEEPEKFIKTVHGVGYRFVNTDNNDS